VILVDTSVIVAWLDRTHKYHRFIRAQAAVLSLPHLTNDRRRLAAWPEVDFVFPGEGSLR
jgi:hypothetical protein